MLRRKLTGKRKPLRSSSVQYPARLREGEDAQDDVTAAKGEPAQHMNQSVFSMIAAAGSKVDFNARFEEDESSDSDDEHRALPVLGDVEEQAIHARAQTPLDPQDEDKPQRERPTRPQQRSAEHRDLPSLPKIDVRTMKEKTYMSQSLRLPSSEGWNQFECPTGVTPRDTPVMNMMLEAQAELAPSALPVEIGNGPVGDDSIATCKDASTSLATRLMEIFGFEKPEEVVSGIWKRRYWFRPAD